MPTLGSRRDLLGTLTFGVLSFAVALGWTLDLHNADSLIPTLVSLDYWLPFFWGQDRFGMLLPLVAAPVHDSFWNLVVQNALGVFLLLRRRLRRGGEMCGPRACAGASGAAFALTGLAG